MLKTISKIGLLCLLIAGIGGIGGCKAASAPAPLPIGARDQIDANANSTLQAAYAFAAEITRSIQSTDPKVHIELSGTQKAIFETLNRSINIAVSAEKAYHAAPSTTSAATLNASVSDVSAKLATAQVSLAPVKGVTP